MRTRKHDSFCKFISVCFYNSRYLMQVWYVSRMGWLNTLWNVEVTRVGTYRTRSHLFTISTCWRITILCFIYIYFDDKLIFKLKANMSKFSLFESISDKAQLLKMIMKIRVSRGWANCTTFECLSLYLLFWWAYLRW